MNVPLARNPMILGAAALGILSAALIAWKAIFPGLPPVAPSASVSGISADGGSAKALTSSATIAIPGAPAANSSVAQAAPKPEFDVVRVATDGAAVVAGRAPGQTSVALMAGEQKVGEAKVDANGQFAIVTSGLPAGDQVLSLRASGAGEAVTSAQSVTVSVAPGPGGKPLTALTAPNEATRVLGAPRADAPVAIRTVEAGDEGAFFASGTAAPGSNVRLYLNGALMAGVTASADGSWALRVERGMAAGHYDVRAAIVDAATGKVLARAAAPFEYPEKTASAAVPKESGAVSAKPGQAAVKPNQTAAAQQQAAQASGDTARANAPSTAVLAEPGVAIVPSVNSVTVVRGDSLWRISRKILGSGVRYTQIYEANASQIRDPDLIWPGQIFVAPQTRAN